MYDMAVIGGGVIGGTILKELSRYKIKSVLLEKESDVCMGASKANSGIVHAGFDAVPGSNKAKFNVSGSKMMCKYANDLGVKYKKNGSLVVAFNDEQKEIVKELLRRGRENGVKGLRIINAKRLRKMEPNISYDAICALYAKTGGIVCPYELTIAAIGSAIDNGAELIIDFDVVNINKKDCYFNIYSADGRCVNAKIIINAAGGKSGKIAELCGDDTVKIGYRRGEYLLLDRESAGFVSHTLFFTPTERGKGILITETADGNVLIGPTAEETADENTATTAEGIEKVIAKAKTMLKNIPFYNTITSFAGIRTYSSDRNDFIVENSKKTERLINVCGIESPGLTSAPAIAKYVVNELIPQEYKAIYNPNYIEKRKPDDFFKTLSERKKNAMIKKDSNYGKIVCRCENVTEGEIREIIRKNPPPTTIDAVKRRLRAGMGRCQGGFCQPRVAEILAEELGIPIEQVKKSGEGSVLLTGKSK
ncbi:MAG: FAD-dependent oxidoreductase [Clostridia bacterium]|nr:FAD-dependent oxidoreductase [Clostridia bacterium]